MLTQFVSRKGYGYFMKKIMISTILIVLLFALCGCNWIIESMDRNNIEYFGKTYSRISQQWEINDPNNFDDKTITHNNCSIKIRTYPYDLNNDFLYNENDGLLFHNNASKFPENNKKDIEYLLLRFHDKTLELKIDDNAIIDEFLSFGSQKKENNVKLNRNIASIMIYYKNFPACYFYGNIITDKEENICIDLIDETSGYLKIDTDSKLLDKVNSVL